MATVEEITVLLSAVKTLLREQKRMEKLSETCMNMDYTNHTPRRIEKANTDLNWQGMDLAKAEFVCHAAAVDCGIADIRSASAYQSQEFNPSAFHKYTYQPPKPKIQIAREESKLGLGA